MPTKVPDVCVIVLSYNRPRMLREALASIVGADEVVVLDDGSSFDAAAAARAPGIACPRVTVRAARRLTVDERMRTPRLGRTVNDAIRATKCAVVAYLCDDDLFHPGWVPAVRAHFASAPDASHYVRGGWGVFDDGGAPGDRMCHLGEHGLTTGNFAHRRSCPLEHGPWWSESRVIALDQALVADLRARHPWGAIPTLPALAGWRRAHQHNMIGFTNGDDYTPAARELLGRGMLET